MKVIKINGKDYPVHFGKSFLLKMETDYKINIMHIQDQIEGQPMATMMNLLKASLDEGARISKKEHNLTIYDIADAWDENEKLMEKAMTLFNESMGIEQKKNTETDPESIQSGD
jgi:hypothetical protein